MSGRRFVHILESLQYQLRCNTLICPIAHDHVYNNNEMLYKRGFLDVTKSAKGQEVTVSQKTICHLLECFALNFVFMIINPSVTKSDIITLELGTQKKSKNDIALLLIDLLLL